MIGLKLAIEQGKAARLQSRDEPGQRDLGGVGRAADHALAEKGAAEREAVEPADQPIAVPAFDRMRIAQAVERDEHVLDRMVDPSVGAIGGRLRA
jgi:hypothetical protein